MSHAATLSLCLLISICRVETARHLPGDGCLSCVGFRPLIQPCLRGGYLAPSATPPPLVEFELPSGYPLETTRELAIVLEDMRLEVRQAFIVPSFGCCPQALHVVVAPSKSAVHLIVAVCLPSPQVRQAFIDAGEDWDGPGGFGDKIKVHNHQPHHHAALGSPPHQHGSVLKSISSRG
eukprot:COSAG04_NODE_7349_length_1143_cov_1.002874_1_plen_178_part_00